MTIYEKWDHFFLFVVCCMLYVPCNVYCSVIRSMFVAIHWCKFTHNYNFVMINQVVPFLIAGHLISWDWKIMYSKQNSQVYKGIYYGSFPNFSGMHQWNSWNCYLYVCMLCMINFDVIMVMTWYKDLCTFACCIAIAYYTNSVVAYDIKVPRLEWHAWDALLHYYHQ